MKRLILISSFLMLCSCLLDSQSNSNNVFGTYELEFDPVRGWDIHQINRHERLILHTDSSYNWELLQPLGTFEVRPENGSFIHEDDKIVLDNGRVFYVIVGHLEERKRRYRKDLRKVPWIKK